MVLFWSGRISFLTYFGSAMPDTQLESVKAKKYI